MKEGFLEKAARKMDLPGQIAGQARVDIRGFREVYIENHQGLLEYGDNEIHINCGKAVLKLKGSRFIIRAMSADGLHIEGQLTGLEVIY